MKTAVITQYADLAEYGKVSTGNFTLCLVTPRINKIVLCRYFIELHHHIFFVYALGYAIPFAHGYIHMEIEAYLVGLEYHKE